MATVASSLAVKVKEPGAPFKVYSSGWILPAILLLSLGLRLYGTGSQGLYIDEIFSVLVATGQGDPELIQFDAVRPFYFQLLRFWMFFWSGEVWMRFLSVVFGVGNVALTYKLGSMVAGRQAGLAASLICALSAAEIHHSQLVRMYTLGTFLVLAGSIAFLKAWSTSSKRCICWWILLRLLAMLTLPLTTTIVLADGLIIWLNRRDNKLMPVLMAGIALTVVCWLPFGYKLIYLPSSNYDVWRALLSPPAASDFLKWAINFTCTAQATGKGPPVHNWLSHLYMLLVPGLIVAGVFCSRTKPKIMWCSLWASVPLTSLFLLSHAMTSFFILRYLMFTAPFVFVLIAAGWAAVWRRWLPVGMIATVIYVVAISCSLLFYYTHPVREDWRRVADFISTHEQPGDKIAIWGYHSAFPMKYYYKGSNQVYDLRVREAKDGSTGLSFSLEGQETPRNYSRLWLISWRVSGNDEVRRKACRRYRQSIPRQFRVLEHEYVSRMDIYLVSPRSGKSITWPQISSHSRD